MCVCDRERGRTKNTGNEAFSIQETALQNPGFTAHI